MCCGVENVNVDRKGSAGALEYPRKLFDQVSVGPRAVGVGVVGVYLGCSSYHDYLM